MSLNGQAIIVADFPMRAGTRFDWHEHADHQLAWAPDGVLIVLAGGRSYILPATRALWIPAGTRHETTASGVATLRSAYLRPRSCPIDWQTPTPVTVSPLLAELINHLDSGELPVVARERAEMLLCDLLTPVGAGTIDVCLPTDPRARDVATALLDEPHDNRTLAGWGRHVGASARTLARAFRSDTGLTFGRWRTLARLQAALSHLAAGTSVSATAELVGYRTTSAFVAAFRAELGDTPSRYFRRTSVGA